MCENGVWLLARDDNSMIVRIMRTDCRMWSCGECAPARQRYWMHRVARGVLLYSEADNDEWVTLTLTARPDRRGRDRSIADFSERWPRLYAKMKRIQPILRYVVVTEQHRDDTQHMHIIINWRGEGTKFTRAKYDKSGRKRTKWRMRDEAPSVGLGYQVHIRPVDSAISAATYASKYMTKALEGIGIWPKGHRLIRTSAHWPDMPTHTNEGAYVWSPISAPSERLLEIYDLQGYDVLDGWSSRPYVIDSNSNTWYAGSSDSQHGKDA